MASSRITKPRVARVLAVLGAACLLQSCTTIQLVSRYDEQTETDVTAIQTDIATFFVKLDTALTPAERSFGASQDFYSREAVAIATLSQRVAAIPKNQLTIAQVELLKENIAWLALLHKGCVTAPLTAAQKTAVADNGIDPSIACRTDYGASADLPDQSKSTLTPLVAGSAHKLIDQGLVAILTLEMAKKRGDSADSGK